MPSYGNIVQFPACGLFLIATGALALLSWASPIT